MNGVLGAAFGAVKAKLVEGHPITEQVTMVYAEGVAAISPDTPANGVPLMRIKAAQVTEITLLSSIAILVEGVSAIGKKVTEMEARRKVLDDIRDLKLTALEQDGHVNPIESAQIRLQGQSFKARAQAYLTNLRMKQKSGRLDSTIFDQVESRLLDEVTSTHGQDYHTWMRAAQGAISIVAELRIQHMASVRVP